MAGPGHQVSIASESNYKLARRIHANTIPILGPANHIASDVKSPAVDISGATRKRPTSPRLERPKDFERPVVVYTARKNHVRVENCQKPDKETNDVAHGNLQLRVKGKVGIYPTKPDWF